MLGNNKSSFVLIKNYKNQNWVKQINLIYYQIYQLVEYEKLTIN